MLLLHPHTIPSRENPDLQSSFPPGMPNPGGFPTKTGAHTELTQGEETKPNPTTQTSH